MKTHNPYYGRVLPLALALVAGLASTAVAEEIRVPHAELPVKFFTAPDPGASAWEGAKAVTIPLFPQVITQPAMPKVTVPEVVVKALHNDKWLAVRLSWADPAPDAAVETDRASDACAIQFPVGEIDKTSPFMGGKDAPVAILHWKALWQQDIDKGFQQVTDLYPNAWADAEVVARTPKEAGGALHVKNPVTRPGRESPVEELIAEGFGTLTTKQHQSARGRGVWADGRWTVVLTRPLAANSPRDASLRIGTPTGIALAIWDGGQGNIGARKHYAPWTTLIMEPRR
ncbi:MAG: hypothetical protein HYV03_07275, partial [Deltaproteobacteria bacterium]|nr:hypothetical protein [Deltaproteobacteria bacterium]